ncbi:response regulator transcription factor [Nocardiopsis composta]|uniref:Two-component system response regulator MprA n=1 Tax=Nocardiopsis composta TaxID=157465 RepID=A0A7W8QMY8_9ACTN|nr:response regulator transcription factor [Nocardiopsis composta]MBB5433261.1 two-component system response regulator MprA [Nocardiopsis composta]
MKKGTVPAGSGAQVLVVEDEPAVREAVAEALELEGYRVRCATDGGTGLEAVAARPPDAIVLDVLMPFMDGITMCRRLRERGDRTPVLILTARDAVGDRVAGLDAGADDYLVKPFDLDELLARLRALLRRAYPDDPAAIGYADLTVDAEGGRAWRGDRLIELSRTEFALLEVLARNAGRVVPRSAISDHVWGYDFGPGSNSIEVYVGYLRRKLEAGGEPRLVHTVRGVGYVLEERAAEQGSGGG